MKPIIEAETETDYDQIRKVHIQAFNGEAEATLVEKLRTTPKYIRELSLVARHRNQVIGHVLFYPIKIKTNKKKCDSLALAPVSVIPKFQNRKIGTTLIQKGLEKAKKLGFKSVIVIGHPEYYPRFGFQTASKYGITAPFKVPDNALLALELQKNALKNCNGTIRYPTQYNETI